MTRITSIATAVPPFRHRQEDILAFMQNVYAPDADDNRKLRYLYRQSGIDIRYSVIGDYSRPPEEWKFYTASENLEPFPSLETRMSWFTRYAPALSLEAIRKCLDRHCREEEITHFFTVSCTGLGAPGLDLLVMERTNLRTDIQRSSVNFMGCYAAIHALKMAHDICNSRPDAKILVVCTELCTLHFQREPTMDNIASSLLFADGAAALLITGGSTKGRGLQLEGFHSEVRPKGKSDMSWEIASTGFLMTLSGYVPDLLEEDIADLVGRALAKNNLSKEQIRHWCVHPGGKKILEAISRSLSLTRDELAPSYQVLRHYGNMSSPTLLFVLKEMMYSLNFQDQERVFGMAFGPGLTIETFHAMASSH